jgi:hypothetical protein
VHYGNYAIERSCRVRNEEGQFETVWVAAESPLDIPSLGYANLNVPASGVVNINLPKCPTTSSR